MTAKPYVWIDEPALGTGLGRVYAGTLADRTDAAGIADKLSDSSGGGLMVKAPCSRFLAYSTAGAPNVSLTYFPRWLMEPTA